MGNDVKKGPGRRRNGTPESGLRLTLDFLEPLTRNALLGQGNNN